MDKRKIKGKVFERFILKTHFIEFGESLHSLLEKYVDPFWKPGDWVAISEKIVSLSQNNVRHISTVKAGWLAKLIVKGVKKYPNDIGYSRPEKMQVAVETAGVHRIIPALIFGAAGKLVGIPGIFWRMAGNRISEIDGFNPDAMWPYDEYAILPPQKPQETVDELERDLGIPVAILDSNNINVEVIAKSKGINLTKMQIRRLFKDNPMGQDDELTPMVMVRGGHAKSFRSEEIKKLKLAPKNI